MLYKKIKSLALFLAFVVLCMSAPHSAFAQGYYTYDVIAEYNYQFDFLASLGIVDKQDIKDMSNEVTRSEYAKIISGFSGYNVGAASVEQKFADVKADEANNVYIQYAVECGYMEASGSIFNPEKPVSAETVLSSVIKVLGYDKCYSNMSAVQIAKSMELTEKVDAYLAKTVTYGVLTQILINAL